jgi:hypothetical protein
MYEAEASSCLTSIFYQNSTLLLLLLLLLVNKSTQPASVAV